MSNFLLKEEKKISNEFKKKGYVVKKIKDLRSLSQIKSLFIKTIKKNIGSKNNFKNNKDLFNLIHKSVEVKKLNNFRLKIINEINKNKNLRELYYKISKPYWTLLLATN